MKKLFAIFTFLLIIFGIVYASEDEMLILKGVVTEAGEPYKYSDEFFDNVLTQDLKVKITDDKYNGTVFPIKYTLTDAFNDKIADADPFEKGDKVYVGANKEDGQLTDIYIQYYDKQNIVWTIIIIYALAILIIGGLNGIKALISLTLTVLAVFFIMVPAIFSGANAMLVSILVSIGIIIVTFLIIGGFKEKTLSAIAGTSCGILVAGIFAVIFGNMMRLTGLNEEALMLTATGVNITFDFRNIMFAGIVIGALGACMDVGMSIASSLAEIKSEVPDISSKKLIKAGMNIGRDVMGTMTNTLILAYVGSAMVTILLFKGLNFEMFDILNQEMIVEEILRSIAGSIGLVCTIPLTALISGLIMGKRVKGE